MDLEFREEILELWFWIWAIDSRRLPIIRLIFPLALSTARAHKLRKDATSFTFSSNLSIDYTNKKMGWKSLTFFRSFSFSVQRFTCPSMTEDHFTSWQFYIIASCPCRQGSQVRLLSSVYFLHSFCLKTADLYCRFSRTRHLFYTIVELSINRTPGYADVAIKSGDDLICI